MTIDPGPHAVLRVFAWVAAVLGGIEVLQGLGYALQRTGHAALGEPGPSLISIGLRLTIGLGFLAWGVWVLRFTRAPKGNPAPRRPDGS